MNIILLSVGLFISSCAGLKTYDVKKKYDSSQIAWSKSKGTSVISGEAFLLKKLDGSIVTCAGQNVMLTARSDYSNERFAILYGFEEDAYGKTFTPKPVQLSGAPSEYFSDKKIKKCNSKGEFSFTQVPNGKYFLEARVWWGGDLGETLMQLIDINKENQTVKVQLNQ